MSEQQVSDGTRWCLCEKPQFTRRCVKCGGQPDCVIFPEDHIKYWQQRCEKLEAALRDINQPLTLEDRKKLNDMLLSD